MWNIRGVSARRRTGRRDASRTVPEDATDRRPCWVGRADPRRRRCAASSPGRAGFPLVRSRPGTCRDHPGIATGWRVGRARQHRGRLGALGGGAYRGHSGCANGGNCRTWLRRYTRTPCFQRVAAASVSLALAAYRRIAAGERIDPLVGTHQPARSAGHRVRSDSPVPRTAPRHPRWRFRATDAN
jgi:hypothetical protein